MRLTLYYTKGMAYHDGEVADKRDEATLLVVDDDPTVCELTALYAMETGFGRSVGANSAEDGLAALRAGRFKLVLLDLGLPDRPDGDALEEFLSVAGDTPLVVVTADERVGTAVRCMKLGAFDYIDKPLSPARLMSLFSHATERDRLRSLLNPERGEKVLPAFSKIITRSPLMHELFHAVERLAPSPLPVLITGESGSGKEAIARAIHELSGRTGAFVPVNSAGIDGTMISDMLFGHEKGAYTGAEKVRLGLVRQSEGGTLFLDEIGDIGMETQVKLLRFIQDGEYYPLGADKPEHSTCRIVLATNADLYEAVRSGRFRADLYYRLIMHSVTIPPLRNRPEDIPLLVEHFARQAALMLKLPPPSIDRAFITAIEGHDFPGNVRELSGLVYGAVGESKASKPSIGYVRAYIAKHRQKRHEDEASGCSDYPFVDGARLLGLEKLELLHIREALRRSNDNQTAAAALLGISQSTISRRLKQLSMHNE